MSKIRILSAADVEKLFTVDMALAAGALATQCERTISPDMSVEALERTISALRETS